MDDFKVLNANFVDVMPKIPDGSIQAIITDPPYGILDHKLDAPFDIDLWINECFRVLKNDGFLVYFCQEPTASIWNVKASQKFNFKEEIIWNKDNASNPFGKIRRTHEKIMIFTKKNGTLNKVKVNYLELTEEQDVLRSRSQVYSILNSLKLLFDKNDLATIQEKLKITNKVKTEKRKDGGGWLGITQYKNPNDPKYLSLIKEKMLTTIWSLRTTNQNKIMGAIDYVDHPTVKPYVLIERLIQLTSNSGDNILDMFSGSGSTGVACLNTNRKYLGIEILPEYYDLQIKRLENHKLKMEKI